LRKNWKLKKKKKKNKFLCCETREQITIVSEKEMTNKLDIEIGDEAEYQGSKVFLSLAEALGLSVDLAST
jgi:hypothetical protein